MNEMQVFQFEANEVRTNFDKLGNIWWVAKDVCDVLQIKNNRDAILKLDDDEKASVLHDGLQYTTISESGLYNLILKSNKPEAKRFKKWITSEVLPKIRKAGSYSVKNEGESIKLVADKFTGIYSVASLHFDHNQAFLATNKVVKQLHGIDFQEMLQIELKNPQQSRPLTPTELGKHFNLSAQQINKRLADCGLQIKKNNVWNATEKGKTHSVLLDVGKKASDGTPVTQLKWYESILPIINLK